MTHPFISQLHFTRKEFLRQVRGVSEEDANEVLEAWKAIAAAAVPWLDTLTSAELQQAVISRGKSTARIYR